MIKGGQDGQGLPKIVNDGHCCSSEVRNGEGSSRMLIDTQGWSEMAKVVDRYSKMVRMFMDGT